ncbi:hypothetical protein KIL84_004374 [Mauremys mutica]|uniref:Uncharacterized protein n=1 Tax=Mauremys mutica TaxID=74926 RepID=A0A9D3XNH0_9SAUR|nr:hypothetical protein KIL84_004374 [Mauremys mutica]
MCSAQHHPIWPRPLGATGPGARSAGGERETLAGLARAAGGHRPRWAVASAVPCQEEQPKEAPGGRGAKRARSRQARRAQGTAGDRCEGRKGKNQPPPESRARAAGAKPAPACPEGNGGGEGCAEPRAGGSRLPPSLLLFVCARVRAANLRFLLLLCAVRCRDFLSPPPARWAGAAAARTLPCVDPSSSERRAPAPGLGSGRACSRGHARSSLPTGTGRGRGAGRKGSSVCPRSGRGRAQERAAPLLSRGRRNMRLGTRQSGARPVSPVRSAVPGRAGGRGEVAMNEKSRSALHGGAVSPAPPPAQQRQRQWRGGGEFDPASLSSIFC